MFHYRSQEPLAVTGHSANLSVSPARSLAPEKEAASELSSSARQVPVAVTPSAGSDERRRNDLKDTYVVRRAWPRFCAKRVDVSNCLTVFTLFLGSHGRTRARARPTVEGGALVTTPARKTATDANKRFARLVLITLMLWCNSCSCFCNYVCFVKLSMKMPLCSIRWFCVELM